MSATELGFASNSSSHRVRRTFGFIDLSGFTAFSNTRGDDDAVRQLSAFRSIVRSVGSSSGVRIAKWLGDGAMLVGLEPAPLVSAILDIVRRMRSEGIELPLHAGVAQGPTILFEGDDYVGQSVNLAARLAELAEPWQVLAPADLIPGLSGTGAVLGAVEVAGWEHPIVVADLTRVSTLVETLNL
jgi:adenylate cyclase